MKHTIPHTLDVYRRAALNAFFGNRRFRRMKQPAGPKTLILSFDLDETTDFPHVPWLLNTLRKHKIKAAFAVVGAWVDKYPDLHKKIVGEGHELLNHTQTHPNNEELNPEYYNGLTREQRKGEIKQCHETVKRILGVSMKGFRSPHFGYQHTKDTYGILEELGYKFCSSTLAIDIPSHGRAFKIGAITEFPLSPCPKHPWALFDSSHAFRGRLCRHTPRDFIKNFEKLLDSWSFVNIYLDLQDFKHYDFERLLMMAKNKRFAFKLYKEML